MASYAVIFCFSVFDKKNRKAKSYLDRFAKFVNKNKIDYAIVSGGFTEPNKPKLSEARTSAEYLAKFIGLKTKIIIDERATSSIDNVLFAGENVDHNPKNKIYVITDAVRFPKIYWLILHYWFKLPRKQVARKWFNVYSNAYKGKREDSKTLTMGDFNGLIRYRNVKLIVDPLHNNYNAAVQAIAAWPVEVEALYDKGLFKDWTLMKKRHVLTKSNR